MSKQFPLPPGFNYGSATVAPITAVGQKPIAQKQGPPPALPTPSKQLGQELGGGAIHVWGGVRN